MAAFAIRGKVIDMATPKDKTQQSTSPPQEGVDQAARSRQVQDGAKGTSADAGRARSSDGSDHNGEHTSDRSSDKTSANNGQDAAERQEHSNEQAKQTNGAANGHYTSPTGKQEPGKDDSPRATVKIKGRPTGVAVELGEGDWAELIELLAERLAAADGFFRGGKVVLEAGPHRLVEEQLREVRNLLELHDMKLGVVRSTSERTLQAAAEVGLATSTLAGDTPFGEAPAGTNEVDGKATDLPAQGWKSSLTSTTGTSTAARPLQLPPAEPGPMPPPPPRPTGHFVHRGSLRSGQILRKAESIVVIGDVNPGAQVISSGDVIVWGRLRGIAYAGVDGNHRSVVAALDFVPTQLRIANLTAIAPEQKRGRWLFFWRREPARRPEIARVADERIVVEPWDEAKIGKFSKW